MTVSPPPGPPNRLGRPPELTSGAVRVVALGGISEVGRNMTVFEVEPEGGAARLLIVDCGMLLGKTNAPGIDITLPDWSAYAARLSEVDAVVLTHGHEDHIGALPYLLRERPDLTVYGSRLTLALLAGKLEQFHIPVSLDGQARRQQPLEADLRTVAEGDRITVGPWDLEFYAVTHSIPDALAVAVRTEAGTLLHTGDFKMDQTPLDGRLTDLPGFARLGSEGVDLLLADSTNAEVTGFNPSELEIGRTLHDVIAKVPGRVVVACFASHVHRVQHVVDAAVAAGRVVAFVGRSMVRNMAIAAELGLLEVPPDTLVDIAQTEALPSKHVVLISTGSQGEPLSALSRMANNEHPVVKVVADDTIILASSLIPGNENSVNAVVNGLARLGATVVDKSNALVHVSGHAPAGELRYLLNVVKPRNLMPVHGEWRHLRAHAAIGESVGLAPERIVLAENGTVVDLRDGEASIVGGILVGHVFVDGLAVGDIGDATLKDRTILGDEGFVSILLAVDFAAGRVIVGPEITARGFSEDPSALDPISAELVQVVERALADGVRDASALSSIVRRTVGRWVDRNYRRRPMLIPMVVEV